MHTKPCKGSSYFCSSTFRVRSDFHMSHRVKLYLLWFRNTRSIIGQIIFKNALPLPYVFQGICLHFYINIVTNGCEAPKFVL